jgi:hypothetical protein
VYYTLDDPMIERLCKLVCETIVRDFEESVRHRKRVVAALKGRS